MDFRRGYARNAAQWAAAPPPSNDDAALIARLSARHPGVWFRARREAGVLYIALRVDGADHQIGFVSDEVDNVIADVLSNGWLRIH